MLELDSQTHVPADFWYAITDAALNYADGAEVAKPYLVGEPQPLQPTAAAAGRLHIEMPDTEIDTFLKAMPRQCIALVRAADRRCKNRSSRSNGRCWCHQDEVKYPEYDLAYRSEV